MTRYSTRTEAIARVITEALGEFAADFDIEAIADEVLTTGIYNGSIFWTEAVEADEFWTIAEQHAL